MVDVAIIGGGLVGASLAYALVRRGARVTVIDRQDVGQATAAGAGILPPLDHFSGVPALLPLLQAARRYYPELIAHLAEDGETETGYAVVGALQVATSESEAERLGPLRRECEARRSAGFLHMGELAELDGRAARRYFPLLGEAVRAALYAAGAARIDGRRLLSALRRAFERRGGRWAQGSAEVVVESGRAVGVRTDASLWPADAVAIAGGAWTSMLGEQLGLSVPVRPQRGQLVHLELPEHETGSWPSVLDFGTHYLLGFGPHRIVAGATREDAGYAAVSTAGGVAGVLAHALWLAPALAHAQLLETRVGLRPICSDGKPLLGVAPHVPNLFLGTGHAGYGLEVGPYSGALLAELILGHTPGIDVVPFAPSRFDVKAAG